MTRLFLFSLVLVSCGKKQQAITPERKDIVEGVYASGSLVPYDQYKVYALADGFLTARHVHESDTVAPGQVLFDIEGEQQDIKTGLTGEFYRQAEVNASAHSPVLQELSAQLASASLKKSHDSLTYTRFKNLYESESTSKAEMERTRLQYQVSMNEWKAVSGRMERTRRQLEVDLKNAQSQYEINAIDQDRYQVKSIISGMVYEIYKEKGELVRRGEPLALLGDDSRMYLTLLVDEQDIALVKIGQTVHVKIDAYGDQVFEARVTKIYPMEKKPEQSFRVDADFVKPLSSRAGLSAEANIVIQHKKNTLVIPKTYLQGKDSVLLREGGKVKITPGIEDADYIEVLGGIDEHSEIVKK